MQKIITPRLILREIKAKDIFGYSELFFDKDSMELYGGSQVKSDLDINDTIEIKRKEYEKRISIFWVITLSDEKEFIGFIRLMSYKGEYFDTSFKAMGELRYSPKFLAYIDKTNGWEIDYALLKEYRGQGIMTETIKNVLIFCIQNKISPIYAKVNTLTNKATISILLKNSFTELLPQVTKEGEMGMVYKWTR